MPKLATLVSKMAPKAPMAVAVAMAMTALLAGTAVTAEMTVDEVIDRHIEARGGLAAWEAIEALSFSGDYTAFSQVAPFSEHKRKDGRYHIDHTLGGKKVIIGNDGETPWAIDEWTGAVSARPLRGPALAVFYQDMELATPLFGYAQRGRVAELVGETELDGQDVLELSLTYPSGEQETWYLDPETYLEVARDATTSEFGRPARGRTFFDDFRAVGDVVIPHYTETQWYTRHRVREIADVTLNPEIDPELFARPAPLGMEMLVKMAGDWEVGVERAQFPGQPLSEAAPTTASIEALAAGGLISESIVLSAFDGSPLWVRNSWTYDRFRERYRVVAFDDYNNLLDIYEGTFDDAGRLTVDNVAAGTSIELFGNTLHQRVELYDIGDDGFKIDLSVSNDGGENWGPRARLTYRRPGAAAEETGGGEAGAADADGNG